MRKKKSKRCCTGNCHLKVEDLSNFPNLKCCMKNLNNCRHFNSLSLSLVSHFSILYTQCRHIFILQLYALPVALLQMAKFSVIAKSDFMRARKERERDEKCCKDHSLSFHYDIASDRQKLETA